MGLKYFFLVLGVLLVAFSLASAQIEAKKSGGADWAIKGDYLDACSCQYVCMCDFGVDPQMHECQGVGAIKIKEGKYGETSLSGLTAAFYVKPGVEWGVYINESATEAQREALGMIMKGTFAEAGKDLGVKTAKIKFTSRSAKATLEIPGVMKVSAERVLNNKKPITVVNGHNPLADKVMAGKAPLNEYKDFNKEWKYEGRNAWFGTFNKRGTSM